ncbi:nipped-b-like protein [Limosa lapponica baueri]|uniref:Nipped-b-like protein n=1 Tax=Limosa lapponica baueri TaxID=1758121 RepID=A0A2I0UTW5_LIMLA|nr:nipped-b-like protein [Limosa lapponica baueri]
MKPRATGYHRDQKIWHANEVPQSAIPVEAGDGVSCKSKDSRDGLEIMEAHVNDQVGIRASPTKNVMGSIAQLKCIYTNAHTMGNKQQELEAIVQPVNYDIVAVTDTWWNDMHSWSAPLDGYKPSEVIGQEREVVEWPCMLESILIVSSLMMVMIRFSVYK